MLRIVELLIDCGISRRDLSAATGVNRDRFTKTFLRENFPQVTRGADGRFRASIEAFIEKHTAAQAWLCTRALPVSAIWESIGEAPHLKGKYPAGHGAKVHGRQNEPAIMPGNPLGLQIREEEKDMLNPRTLRHFKLFSNPFAGEIRQEKDIFLGEEHIFLREMMLETARNCGMTAVIGEVGSGKSIMRKAVAGKLINEGVKIIYPLIVDKSRISPSSLIDAIIMDISEETPKRSLEAKTRQAFRLLKNRAAAGLKQVLMIEEAHLLTAKAIKCLKQIHELENGFDKVLGIIILGQPELKNLLDETMHPELREVIRRITVAEITDLGQEIEPYLKHKFSRIAQGRFPEIFAPDSIEALARRLLGRCYPLAVNALAAKAMNLAADMGEAVVTPELVNMA